MLFNGTSSRAETTGLGGVSSTNTDAITFAAIIRRNTSNVFTNIVDLYTSGTVTSYDMTISSGNVLQLESNSGTSSGPDLDPNPTGWHYVACDRPSSGSAVAIRYHKLRYLTDTAMAHSNGGTLGPSGVRAKIGLGTFDSGSDWFNGDIQFVGIWNRQLADWEHEWLAHDLTAWFALAPDWMVQGDYGTLPTNIQDLSANGGAPLTTLTNLAATTNSGIPFFTYGGELIYLRPQAAGGTTVQADTAAATADGISATGKATHTATVGAATADGISATGKATHTETTGAATAAGINAAGSVRHDATTGAATAAGIAAAGGQAVTATTGAATAAGVTATFSNSVTATTGVATAAGIDASFFSGTQGSGAPHHCPPFVVAGPTRNTDVAPDRVYSTDVGGTTRTSDVIGTTRTTDAIGDIRTTDVIGTTRSTDVIGDTRHTDDKDAC